MIVLQPTKLRSKSTLGKKTEARNAILAKIRQRKQNKGKPTVIPDSDEEVQPRAASSASEEDPPDQAIDDDDDEDSESGESVKSADFIVEDGEDQEDVRALIPAQFTSEFTQKPIFHFRNFCQVCRAFAESELDIDARLSWRCFAVFSQMLLSLVTTWSRAVGRFRN